MGHANYFCIGGQRTTVEGTSSHYNRFSSFIVDSGEFQTSRGREETVAVLAAAHARRLQHVAGEVVVEWILAGRIAAVHRNALEAIDGAHCSAVS